jgi:hypothetical protein
MMTMLRESLHAQLALLPAITDLSARSDPSFPDRAQEWLAATEKSLSQLRRPEAGLFATLRGRLLSSREGFRDPQVPGEMTNRKALRAAATVYLSQGEGALRETLAQIEDQLRPLRAQLAQLVSAGCLLGLIPQNQEGPREEFLRLIWSRLSEVDQTRGMATYLRTTLAAIDRLYLLDELLGNLRT